MRTRIFASALLCAAPLVAVHPGWATAGEPARLTAAEMDEVTAGGASVVTNLGRKLVSVVIGTDEKGQKATFRITDPDSNKVTKKIVRIGKGSFTDHFDLDGSKVVIVNHGSKCNISLDSHGTSIDIVATPSGVRTSSQVVVGSAGGHNSHNTTSSSSSSSSSSIIGG